MSAETRAAELLDEIERGVDRLRNLFEARDDRGGKTVTAEMQARAEALDVAAILLGRVVDYWDGRPLAGHGEHIYADLRDVLAGIKRDADHNRTKRGRVTPDGGDQR